MAATIERPLELEAALEPPDAPADALAALGATDPLLGLAAATDALGATELADGRAAGELAGPTGATGEALQLASSSTAVRAPNGCFMA
ncbi:MAG TPA: hypothetical protein VF157_06415 [Chloroflexota bacterium]